MILTLLWNRQKSLQILLGVGLAVLEEAVEVVVLAIFTKTRVLVVSKGDGYLRNVSVKFYRSHLCEMAPHILIVRSHDATFGIVRRSVVAKDENVSLRRRRSSAALSHLVAFQLP